MFGEVLFEPSAHQDICSIGDSSIAGEIYDICGREIRVLAEDSEIEGWLRGRPGYMWRRAVPLDDLALVKGYDIDEVDDFGRQACDYVIIYRLMNDEDKIRYKRKGDALLVLAVLHNRDWVPYYLDQLPKFS